MPVLAFRLPALSSSCLAELVDVVVHVGAGWVGVHDRVPDGPEAALVVLRDGGARRSDYVAGGPEQVLGGGGTGVGLDVRDASGAGDPMALGQQRGPVAAAAFRDLAATAIGFSIRMVLSGTT